MRLLTRNDTLTATPAKPKRQAKPGDNAVYVGPESGGYAVYRLRLTADGKKNGYVAWFRTEQAAEEAARVIIGEGE